MNIFKIVGKYLDQPILVANFKKKVPAILAIGGATCVAYKTRQADPEQRKNTAVKLGTTMAFTIASALLAPKVANELFKVETKSLAQIKENNTKLVDEFIKNNSLNSKTKEILTKTKEK